jgi:hypothetical protein
MCYAALTKGMTAIATELSERALAQVIEGLVVHLHESTAPRPLS